MTIKIKIESPRSGFSTEETPASVGDNILTIKEKLDAVDLEFKSFLSLIGSDHRTIGREATSFFSPLKEVQSFAQRGLQLVGEVGPEEMFHNDEGICKLLGNMFAECAPGTLNDADLLQITSINGRDIC